MNINELKVGDRVRFFGYKMGMLKEEYTGILVGINLPIYYIRDDFYHCTRNMKAENIISKLEALPIEYIETPIEKEETKWIPESCVRCGKSGKYKRGEYYFQAFCDKCRREENKEIDFKKELEERLNLRTIPDKAVFQDLADGLKRIGEIAKKAGYSLSDLINKVEKPAPKSFKSNYTVGLANTIIADEDDYICLNRSDWVRQGLKLELGKTYTIEIKEKQ